MPDEENPENPATSSLISVKAPQFSDSSAVGWFAVLEAQFILRNITQTATKFYNALAALPPHLVTNMPPEVIESANYDILKKTVIESYEQTKPELFERLSQKTTMTGRPSQYLRELQILSTKAGIDQCEDLIRHKFLDALPRPDAPALATQETLPLFELGSLADELLPIHSNICNLTPNIQTLSQKNKPHSQEKFNTYSENQKASLPLGLQPFSANQRPKICRFHIYFADKATKCKPWCRYPNKRGCSVEPSSRPSSPHRYSENPTGGLN